MSAAAKVDDNIPSLQPAEDTLQSVSMEAVDPIADGSTADSAGPETLMMEEPLRAAETRPALKLSLHLIDTYKYINKVYYEAKAKKLREKNESHRGGVHNDGYDDQNYDYIIRGDELFNDRYVIKYRMGKGSFGQVVCAYDQVNKVEVAVKIIKSRKPFLIQARTEIEMLEKILEKDTKDDHHLVRLLDHFVFRNHQCLVFEILSYNLYELLRNTKFKGVSLNLIRKFSTQLLRALELLSRPDVNIIHCDLKPENILLRHPKRSAIKVIDFGSSCYQTKRTYTYIQSRFYRSPEVLLGLPYSQKIDIWSLGCVAAEMHIGEPLFGGANQVDQMCRIVDMIGLPPLDMIKRSPEKTRSLFFEKTVPGTEASLSTVCDLNHIVYEEDRSACYVLKRPNKDMPAPRLLQDILGVHIGGPSGRRLNEANHNVERYQEFLHFLQCMLVYDPERRASPTDLLSHAYINFTDEIEVQAAAAAVPINDSQAVAANKASAIPVAAVNGQDGSGEQAAPVAMEEQDVAGNKDTERGRRTSADNHSKVRSQSAPGGISNVRLFGSGNASSNNNNTDS